MTQPKTYYIKDINQNARGGRSLNTRGSAPLWLLSVTIILALLINTYVVYGTPNLVTGSFGSEFLEKVVGFNMTDYRTVLLHVGQPSMLPNSHHYFTPLTIVISNLDNDTEFTANFGFIDGKMWYYLLDGNFGGGNLTLDDCLSIGNSSITAYTTLVNTPNYNKLPQMLSVAIGTKTLRVEDENSSLQISCISNCLTPMDYKQYVSLNYTNKIDGVTIPMEGLGLSVSKNGLLTWLGDGSMYTVADTTVAVSEEEAINMSLPYAMAYAGQHGQSVTAVNATFAFARDWSCLRGNDDFAIYPLWNVLITFDKVNEQNVLTYDVAVWADNGQIYNNAPQPMNGLSWQQGASADPLWQFTATVVAISALALLLIPGLYVMVKKRGGRNR
jgi:hypothetical protein